MRLASKQKSWEKNVRMRLVLKTVAPKGQLVKNPSAQNVVSPGNGHVTFSLNDFCSKYILFQQSF
jgi:hypothetical protein